MGGKYFSALASKGLGDSKELNCRPSLGINFPNNFRPIASLLRHYIIILSTGIMPNLTILRVPA